MPRNAHQLTLGKFMIFMTILCFTPFDANIRIVFDIFYRVQCMAISL